VRPKKKKTEKKGRGKEKSLGTSKQPRKKWSPLTSPVKRGAFPTPEQGGGKPFRRGPSCNIGSQTFARGGDEEEQKKPSLKNRPGGAILKKVESRIEARSGGGKGQKGETAMKAVGELLTLVKKKKKSGDGGMLGKGS